MNRREKDAFIKSQMADREAAIARLKQEHGARTVEMALHHLDEVTDLYPGGMDSMPRICEHIRAKRYSSRSWNLAGRIFIEMLKNLGEHLETIDRKRRRRTCSVHSSTQSTLQM